MSSDRNEYPTDYMSWGHDAGGKTARCTLVTESLGTCTLDSLSSFNVLMNPLTTPNHLGHHVDYGMNASGGSDQVRFFVSGDVANENGPSSCRALLGPRSTRSARRPSDEWINPEAYQQVSLRTNLSAALSPKFDLNANAGFSNFNQRLPQTDNNIFSYIYSALNNPGFNHNGAPLHGTRSSTTRRVRPCTAMATAASARRRFSRSTTRTERNGSSARPTRRGGRLPGWSTRERPASISPTTTSSASAASRNARTRDAAPRRGQPDARTISATTRQRSRANRPGRRRSSMNIKTTFGFDYGNLENDGVNASGTNLPPGAQTVGQAAVQTAATRSQTVNKTLGLYVQEQASFRDRLFWSARSARTRTARSVRSSSVYLPEGQRLIHHLGRELLPPSRLDESAPPARRLWRVWRAARRHGRPPDVPGVVGEHCRGVVAGSGVGSDTPGLLGNALGNPDLKPERSAETEVGFEASLFGNRSHLDFTYYHKRTSDALVSQPIAASSGASTLSVLKNLSSVLNTGIEAS